MQAPRFKGTVENPKLVSIWTFFGLIEAVMEQQDYISIKSPIWALQNHFFNTPFSLWFEVKNSHIHLGFSTPNHLIIRHAQEGKGIES